MHAQPATLINVRDFGATRDGIADDTAAIEAALTAGSVGRKAVVFPSGTYRFTDTLAVGGLTIVCRGWDNTYLVFDDTSTTKYGITVGHTDFRMHGCNYDRKQSGTRGALLHFTDSYYSSIYNNFSEIMRGT